MSEKKGLHLRFAVGSLDGPRSMIWRLWTGMPKRSDVYLAPRGAAASLKASLHQSGLWQVSFTTQFVENPKGGVWWEGSRHIDRWTRPADISPGVILAFRIVIPTSELRVMPVEIKENKCISWFTPPPIEKVAEFAIILTKPEVVTSDWPGMRAMSTELVARQLLPNGENLCVVYHTQEMTDGILKRVETLRSRVANGPPDFSLDGSNSYKPSHRMIIGGEEPDGSRFYLEVARDTILGPNDSKSFGA